MRIPSPNLWRALFGAGLLAAATAAPADPAPSREYQVKAAFLFNFARFVEWPSAAYPSAAAPLRIGILGDDPFGPALDHFIQGETIRNRGLEIQRSHRIEDLRSCQLIFISSSEKGQISGIVSTLDSSPILTVSDFAGFAARGGIISFYLDGNRVRFEINPETARRDGLKISSQLLSVGKIVRPEAGDGS